LYKYKEPALHRNSREFQILSFSKIRTTYDKNWDGNHEGCWPSKSGRKHHDDCKQMQVWSPIRDHSCTSWTLTCILRNLKIYNIFNCKHKAIHHRNKANGTLQFDPCLHKGAIWHGLGHLGGFWSISVPQGTWYKIHDKVFSKDSLNQEQACSPCMHVSHYMQ
jgi:hypothetical protein